MHMISGSDRVNDNQTRSERGTVENMRGREVLTRVGSHAKEVTRFECEFRGSLIGIPVLGSHITEMGWRAREGEFMGRTARRFKYG